MTMLSKIQRWNISGQYHSTVYEDEDDKGEWVLFEDYLKAIESLEYDIRYYREQMQDLKEERNYYEDMTENLRSELETYKELHRKQAEYIIEEQEERERWKDAYNELYEQQQL